MTVIFPITHYQPSGYHDYTLLTILNVYIYNLFQIYTIIRSGPQL